MNPASQLLRITVAILVLMAAGPAAAEIQFPPEHRTPVDLERELQAPWQAGGEIVVFAAEDGSPRAGRLTKHPTHAGDEHDRRVEHFALARKLNLVTQPRVVPFALPLSEEQVTLLERFALSDAGAVWFREVADDTLRLFNLGYLDYDRQRWKAFLQGGPRPVLSHLITGRLSDAGLFSQEVAIFRIFAFDGAGSQAAAASVRMGHQGFRCQFQISGEAVDPFAVLSHEFGHSRYGDPKSAGHPLGEARTVARYENPVRLRNGFAPRLMYYLRIEPGRLPATRDPLFARLLSWRETPDFRLADLDPVEGLYCECLDTPGTLRDCLKLPAADTASCELRWIAVRVETPALTDPDKH